MQIAAPRRCQNSADEGYPRPGCRQRKIGNDERRLYNNRLCVIFRMSVRFSISRSTPSRRRHESGSSQLRAHFLCEKVTENQLDMHIRLIAIYQRVG